MSVAKWYGAAPGHLAQARVNLLTDAIKCALLTNAYAPDQDAHAWWSDVLAVQAVGAGYVAGGQALTTVALTYVPAGNMLVFSADPVIWTPVTVTARYAVVYKDTGVPATSPLLLYVDGQADYVSVGGFFRVSWNPAGIGDVVVA